MKHFASVKITALGLLCCLCSGCYYMVNTSPESLFPPYEPHNNEQPVSMDVSASSAQPTIFWQAESVAQALRDDISYDNTLFTPYETEKADYSIHIHQIDHGYIQPETADNITALLWLFTLGIIPTYNKRPETYEVTLTDNRSGKSRKLTYESAYYEVWHITAPLYWFIGGPTTFKHSFARTIADDTAVLIYKDNF